MVKKYIENSSEEGTILIIDAFMGELIDALTKHLNGESVMCSLCNDR